MQEEGSVLRAPQPADQFVNSSFYIMPFCFEDLEAFSAAVEQDSRWEPVSRQEYRMKYLLSYVGRLAEKEEWFRSFRLREPEQVRVCFKVQEERGGPLTVRECFNDQIRLAEVRLSCFGSGIGFLEFRVTYHGLPIASIIDFAFRFKKASPHIKEGSAPYGTLYRTGQDLLPAACRDAQIFFYSTDEIKNECICYHMLKLAKDEVETDKLEEQMFLLRRGYGTQFAGRESRDSSSYDMVYTPYQNDWWGGSQEGLTNLCYETGDDAFLRGPKYLQLQADYHFMYLLLLNQRYAAIKNIEMIAAASGRKELKELNRRIVKLKTIYSFRVVSNDLIYQNIYSRMYDILEINPLLRDLQDNEQQVELMKNDSEEEFEGRANKLLIGISFLSIFSALIDAATYFELFPILHSGAKWISLLVVAAMILIWLTWMRRKK